MKTIFKSIIYLSIIFIFSCDNAIESELLGNDEIITVSYGTSFGECLGYCKESIAVTDTILEYTSKGWNIETVLPEINFSVQITENQWRTLVDKIDFVVFRNLEEVIGCPDCNDGGAEWIEIKTKNLSHKITFEYQNEPDAVSGYIDDLRALMLVANKVANE